MNVAAILSLSWPGSFARIQTKYNTADDLQTFLDTQVEWAEGFTPPTAGEVVSAESAYLAHIAAIADGKRKTEIKQEARQRIESAIGATQTDPIERVITQMNVIRSALLAIYPTLPLDTQTTVAPLVDMSNRIDVIRAASNRAEANGTTIEEELV